MLLLGERAFTGLQGDSGDMGDGVHVRLVTQHADRDGLQDEMDCWWKKKMYE